MANKPNSSPTQLRTALEADFNRVNISSHDFEEAHSFLSRYEAGGDEVVRRALLMAAIVSYARPFTRSRGAGKTAPFLSLAVEEILTDSQLILHATLLDLRHKGVAHSDFERNPTRRVASPPGGVLMWTRRFDVLGERIDVATFRAIAWRLHMACVSRLHQINRELENGGSHASPHDGDLGGGALRLNIPLSRFKPPA